jgi:tetratricopeptide (TPR) repeat protein
MSVMRYPSVSVVLFLAGVAAPAAAVRPSLGALYVHARAAEVAGDVNEANAGFATLLAADPSNPTVATRAYRQALSGGDMALALKAAQALATGPALPSDARVLLALAAIKAHDWPRAQASADALTHDGVFGFLAPYLRAWIAVSSGKGDPLALVEPARAIPLASPYFAQQRALLLVALGRRAEAVGALTPQAAEGLPATIKDAEHGLSPLLAQLAADFARQQYVPVGMIMARMAAYAAPDYGGAWLVLAELLHRMQRQDLALAAIDHIAANDPLAGDAHTLRIALLNDSGKHEAALAEAIAAAKRDHAGSDDWGRVGDLYLMLSKPSEAAAAYAKALGVAEAARAPASVLWPILLQQGGALDLAGNWPAAKAAMMRAYALAPNDPAVLNQVGYSEIEHRENVDKASAMIAEASRQRPDDPAITDSLGWVLHLQGKTMQAVPLLERAAAGNPAEPTINEHLGDVYWTIGRQLEARYAWRAALITAEEKDRARLNAKIEGGLDKGTAAP